MILPVAPTESAIDVGETTIAVVTVTGRATFDLRSRIEMVVRPARLPSTFSVAPDSVTFDNETLATSVSFDWARISPLAPVIWTEVKVPAGRVTLVGVRVKAASAWPHSAHRTKAVPVSKNRRARAIAPLVRA